MVSLSDAGASPTHQASQRGGGRQLDKPAQILKTLWELLRKSLMKPFMKAHLYIVMDLERIALVLR
jgi:hypothetical protein